MSAELIDETVVDEIGVNELNELSNANGDGNGGELLVSVLPEELLLPEATNVRPWSGTGIADSEEDLDKIERLSATIEEEGQILPIRVRWNAEASAYEVTDGRRRVKAIQMINATRKPGKELRVKAVVAPETVSDIKAFRQALIANWHREDLSPMDMALDIAVVREKLGYDGAKATKKVALFFRVSPATVTQYEKLLGLDKETQALVHTGKLSRDAAFKLLKELDTISDPKERVERTKDLLMDAEVKQREINARAAEAEAEAAVATGNGKAKKKARTSTGVSTQAMSQTIREKGTTAQPRSKKEIVEWFEGLQGPAYGYADGAVHQFVGAFLRFCAGEVSERTLGKYFDTMVEKADRGKPEPKTEKAKESAAAKTAVVTAASGKTKAKAKAAVAGKKK